MVSSQFCLKFFFDFAAKIHPKSKMQMLWEFYKIQEICSKIGTRIFKIDQEMTEKIELKVGTPQKSEAENGPI